MNKGDFLLAATLILLSCGGAKSGKTDDNTEISYETYYNERYDYGVAYPDFLVPQSESASEDGQTFVSKDGKQKMMVYRTFKALSSENPTVESAFAEDLAYMENITEKGVFDNYYLVKGKIDDNTIYKVYTVFANDDYYAIRFEYPAADEPLFEAVSKHVSKSFNVGLRVETDEFVVFLNDFLNECFWNVNFNALLRDNDRRLKKYIDQKMDIRRYYNPGAIAYLYTRADNFGFEDFNDFDTKPEDGGELSFKKLEKNTSPCELDFNHGKGFPEIYYAEASGVPDEVVNPETFEVRPVKLPYQNAKIMVVYLPQYYRDNVNARGFYFIETPKGWKLAFVDDSLCSA